MEAAKACVATCEFVKYAMWFLLPLTGVVSRLVVR